MDVDEINRNSHSLINVVQVLINIIGLMEIGFMTQVQGYSTSPTLFKILLEQTAILEKEMWRMEIPVKSDHPHTLSFVDDQAAVEKDEEDLSFILKKLEDKYEKSGSEINLFKTTSEEAVMDLEIEDGILIRGTVNFEYLGFAI